MRLLDWFRRGPRHNPEHKAVAEQRLQRLVHGFHEEMESMQVPTESAPRGQMPAVMARPRVDYEGGSSEYPWEKQAATEVVSEVRRRY
jgi:hypothetical protein